MSDEVAPLRISEVTFDPEAILRALDDNGVDYILIGGLAARLHGSPLTTVDADINARYRPGKLGSSGQYPGANRGPIACPRDGLRCADPIGRRLVPAHDDDHAGHRVRAL